MFFKKICKKGLIALLLMAGLFPFAAAYTTDPAPESVNLALRRTADALLRSSGDHTSRIPAVEPMGQDIWQIRLDQPFDYDALPALLRESLKQYGISSPYEVMVRQCESDVITLGYHWKDVLRSDTVPCSGRELPPGCHYIEIRFLDEKDEKKPLGAGITGLLLLLLGGGAGWWWWRRQKPVNPAPCVSTGDWLAFGDSRLDSNRQLLVSGGTSHTLTYRETKLLRLFATHLNTPLERDQIVQQVWADEGILVSRSVDVFVSRLRKKLSADPTVTIATVHGIGYRLEAEKEVSLR